MPLGLGVLFLLAVACGSPAATSETVATTSGSAPAATAPAAAVPQQAVATVAPASEQVSSSPAQQQAEPAVSTAAERPTLTAGVIWLDSPLDPVDGSWVISQSALAENLFRLSPTDFTPDPWLATAATQTDPLTWEIEIRSGVTFHNGTVMDAEAVKASLERVIRLSPSTAESLNIASITVIDEQTIIVTTVEPQPTLPSVLTDPGTAIHDAAAADAAGEGNFIAAGALTGPYIPIEYIRKERLETVAHDDYWAGRPPLAGIKHIAIPDTKSRELALQAGDIDIAINISPEGARTIDAQPGMHSQTSGIGTSVVMWWVNFERGTMSDPLVRSAVVQAIDREGIAGLVAPEGAGSFAELLLPEELISCPGVSALNYDPDRARELLAEAGYTDTDGDGFVDRDGQPLEIVIGGYPQRFQLPIMSEAAQAMLTDVGIKTEVFISEWSAVKEPVWDLFGWYHHVVEAGDPVLNLSTYTSLHDSNYGQYDNTELVDLVVGAGNVSDPGEREQIACEILGLVTEDSAFLPVAHVYVVYGVSERVTGFVPHSSSLYFFDHRIGLSE